ncbi:colicin import membrane protein [Aquamicrobium terrae]
MRAGLTTSVLMHAALLGFGLLTLRAPAAFEVTDVEALPVDIVPVESITRIQEGDKKATMRDKPAPTPTQRPDIVADAQKVGENSVDTDKPATPDAKPTPVQANDSPPPSPMPAERPKPEDAPKPKEAPKPTPATEVAPTPQPREEVKPDPVKQPEPKPEPVKEPTPAPKQPEQKTAAAEQALSTPDPVAEAIAADKPSEAVQLPSAAPAPEAKPRPAQAETAKAPDRKDADKPVKEASSRPKSDEKSFNADEIAALLDKRKPSGGGAKRSTQQASLGGQKNTGGNNLSQNEMDALRGQVEKCWNIPAGAEDGGSLKVSVKFRLDRSGAVEGPIDIVSGGGANGVQRAAAESARRAVARCSPYNLPADKYDSWSEVVVNFDPSDMF